jgi:AcrR family transcriptional regulator
MTAAQRTLRRAVSDEDKQQRRDEILRAAKQVFADNGYHDTTIADVARGAGLSYGVVYWYFDSKDDLFRALMTAEEEALRDRIAAAVRDRAPDDLLGVLRTSIEATFEHFEADREATRLLFRDTRALGGRFASQLASIFGRFTGELEALIVDAQGRGLVRRGPAHLMAYSCTALIGQLALRRQMTNDDLSVEEAAQFTVELLTEGLAAPQRPERKAKP